MTAKKILNKLMKEFIEDCNNSENNEGFNRDIKPTFQNFIYWLDNKSYKMI